MIPEKSKWLTLNIFTLNCWGIPIVSKNRKERFEAIGNYLVESSHNIVCLQEVWSEKDYLFLKERVKEKLPYSHYFYRLRYLWFYLLPTSDVPFSRTFSHLRILPAAFPATFSGVLGSGLCVFSKWLIQDIFFHQWPLNGYIHKIHHGDWFGGKGIGLCRIRCGERLVNIYCTHLHAEYHVDDIYLAHRVLQAHSTAEFVHLTAPPADVSILAGDLNTAPGDLSFKIISELPSLLDPYDMVCEGSNPNVKKQSGTCGNSNNSYSNPDQVKLCPDGKRIDHILFRCNAKWEPVILSYGNPLDDRVPGESFSYSDHNAVSLELSLKPSTLKTPMSMLRQMSKDETIDKTVAQAIKVCEEATSNLSKTRKLYLLTGSLILMFLVGTFGFWPNFFTYDLLKIVLSAIGFYYLSMGSLWNRIEVNSLKAGLSALYNFRQTRLELKGADKKAEMLL